MQNEAYQKLMDNLCDIVAEEQAKLGYMKEPIRLYYPLSSLNHFFGGDVSADVLFLLYIGHYITRGNKKQVEGCQLGFYSL